jgi:hypothetical protein
MKGRSIAKILRHQAEQKDTKQILPNAKERATGEIDETYTSTHNFKFK